VKRPRNILDSYTGAELAASPRLARAWARAWHREVKRLGYGRKKRL